MRAKLHKVLGETRAVSKTKTLKHEEYGRRRKRNRRRLRRRDLRRAASYCF